MLVSVTVSTHSLLVRQDMAPHSKYVKAERALNAIATMSCKKICMKGDDAMSRSLSSKSILRLDRFLSMASIDTWLHTDFNSESVDKSLFVSKVIRLAVKK